MKQNIKISAFAMPVIVAFAYVIWKSCLDWGILLVLLPVGLMTCGIFRASCTIAAVTDHDDGPDTFAPGSMTAAYIYGFELIFPYAWVAACSISGLLPRLTVITFLTIAVAIAYADDNGGCAKGERLI